MAPHTDFAHKLRPAPPDGATIIKRERLGSDLDADQLGQYLHGKTYIDRQQRILDIVRREKLFDKTQQTNLSRPDRYKLGLARGKRLRQLQDVHRWDDEDFVMAEYLVDDVQPYHLHISLFTAALREQTNDEQRAYWMPKVVSWEIIGAYAQTELGHGSNVRGIETEARWDPQSQHFILHSPHLTASKWWNGTLGRTATHAVVIAQLLLPAESGKTDVKHQSHGPHPFIVQVRDTKTHQPPNSIIVGDIGPKYGYAPMDNAYMLIPHSALLSRYSQLDLLTRVYTKSKNPSSLYGQLTRGRAVIAMHARLVLARAVTVAVRYLSIRRQFHDRDDPHKQGPALSVLDYSTVQIRILPLLATTFALHYSGLAMRQLYERTRNSSASDGDRVSENADMATLMELHSTSAGLKSLATELAANGIETCRRAMGGHGYGGGTGLIQLNADYLSKPTVEGDNWMITQQVAKYLIKKVKERAHSLKGQALNKTEENLKDYLYSRTREPNFKVLEDDATLVQAFNWRMSWLASRAYDAREVQRRPWNSLLVEFHKLSRAYSQAMLVSNFHTAIASAAVQELPTTTRNALTDPFRLFALNTMDHEAREFQKSGAVSSDTLDEVSDTVLSLMTKIRPHAVKLVDAWALPDYLLDSALGRYDGRVYEDLFNRAHVLNPLNKVTFNPDYRNDEIVLGSGDVAKIQAKL
ncbi:acyl-CoA dehydrogenase/oxidase C-terminal [Exophiala viscosa]|uniref:acyl-CoA dehydrogenase/oxidase C-terminal n=1 Tax=Exophiala viscosa TaxID=2486360 RepID=UPI00219C23DF|nr:acyl-CoA dehydrogenase/oxidase C-terminal [Exophiala viscosa]